jgi:hypothetical protein
MPHSFIICWQQKFFLGGKTFVCSGRCTPPGKSYTFFTDKVHLKSRSKKINGYNMVQGGDDNKAR